MKNKTIWKFLWEQPIILISLLTVWILSIASISWFINNSGEENPLWILMFLLLPISIMLLAWLLIKIMHQGNNM
jgi:predicted membrane channel-forming protein YqfA (hemolysin III family)